MIECETLITSASAGIGTELVKVIRIESSITREAGGAARRSALTALANENRRQRRRGADRDSSVTSSNPMPATGSPPTLAEAGVEVQYVRE